MIEDRYCKFKDGTIKSFEEIKAGDVFQIFEPTGILLWKQYFKAGSDYDDNKGGFTGDWIEDKEEV